MSHGSHHTVAAAFLSVSAICLFGCSDGLQLVPVTGTVTLDGLPLVGASVVFHPEQGRLSAGTTDAEGRYTLRYTDEKVGALPGEHTVQIATAADDDEDSSAPRREKLPARYNLTSELRATVSADSPQHDFALDSK